MKVLHVSQGGSGGGANAAGARIEESTQPLVRQSKFITPSGAPNWSRGLPAKVGLRIQKSTNPVHRSLNIFPSGIVGREMLNWCDVVHLHWVGSETLSIKEIAWVSSQKPVVWTLHDAWAFSGADHHPRDETDLRYQLGYTKESRLPGDAYFDVDAWTFRRKQRRWIGPMWLAAPSRHMQWMVEHSAIARDWPVEVIPNPVDTTVFSPVFGQERSRIREQLGVSSDAPLMVLGTGLASAHTKGIDLLPQIVGEIQQRKPEAKFMSFGTEWDGLPRSVRQIGFIRDESKLTELYSAADVVIVPSRFESFSQVAAEAQSCGTPVAAFATSGLLDVVAHGETGFLAEPFDPHELALAAIRVLDAGEAMRKAARERAVKLWSFPVVGAQYARWYEIAQEQFKER